MRFYFFLLVLFFPLVALGQSTERETILLQAQLGLSKDYRIELAETKKLPSKDPLKVLLATGLDIKARDRYVKWIEKWNHTSDQSGKYGKLQIVRQLSEADVILARLVDNMQIGIRSGPIIFGEAGHYSRHTSIFIPIGTVIYRNVVPVYSYILVKEGTILKVVERRTSSVPLNNTSRSSHTLWNKFTQLLEKRKD